MSGFTKQKKHSAEKSSISQTDDIDESCWSFENQTKGVILGEFVNVRERPDKSSRAICNLRRDKQIKVTSQVGDFFKVEANIPKEENRKSFLKVSGYILKELVKIEEKDDNNGWKEVGGIAGGGSSSYCIERDENSSWDTE